MKITMMKKYAVLYTLCMLTSSVYGNIEPIDEHKLLTAIRNINRESVALQLAQGNIVTQVSKDRLLEASEELIEQRAKYMSLFKSWPDMLANLAGSLGLVVGTFSLIGLAGDSMGILSDEDLVQKSIDWGMSEQEAREDLAIMREWKLYYVAKSVVILGLGQYLKRRGWNLASATFYLEEAKQIHALVENTPVTSTP